MVVRADRDGVVFLRPVPLIAESLINRNKLGFVMNPVAKRDTAFAFLCCCTLSLAADAATPNPKTDTISPAYDWQTFPYDWAAIRSGRFELTPVHWQRFAGNPVIKEGMNARPVLIDKNSVRVYYGVPGPQNGIFYFDVDAEQPETVKAVPIGPIISPGSKGSYDSEWVICPEPVRLSKTHLRMY